VEIAARDLGFASAARAHSCAGVSVDASVPNGGFRPARVNEVPPSVLLESERVPLTVRVVNLAGEPLKGTLAEQIYASTKVGMVCNPADAQAIPAVKRDSWVLLN